MLANLVPVGQDQLPHVEVARLTEAVNERFAPIRAAMTMRY